MRTVVMLIGEAPRRRRPRRGLRDERNQQRACHRATRPDGVLALTLKEGDGEAWSEAKLSSPRWFVYWREGPLRGPLSDAG